jgi:IclR family acetate operon transcriptional repressor
VAALSISAPCQRMGEERINQIGILVRQAAEKVTAQLGGRVH